MIKSSEDKLYIINLFTKGECETNNLKSNVCN